MNISFCLVVYNEEKNIRRCLESIKDVAEEILIVHDGACHDRTLDIAREYTDHVFVRGRLGGSDPHRIFLLERAAYDWAFMIDADEFLSAELQIFLKTADEKADCGAFAFLWPVWDGEKYVTTHNYRPVLFRKKQCWAVGLHNFSTQTIGPVCKKPFRLEHRPKNPRISGTLFPSYLYARVDRDANMFVKDFDALETYNAALIPNSFKHWFKQQQDRAGLYLFWRPIKYFLGTYKNVYKDGRVGFVLAVRAAAYRFLLSRRIWQLKRKK